MIYQEPASQLDPTFHFVRQVVLFWEKKIWLREKAAKAANPMGDLGRQTALTISHVRASARRSCLISQQTGQNAAGSLQRYKCIQANSIAVSYLTDGAQGYSEEFDLEGGADG